MADGPDCGDRQDWRAPRARPRTAGDVAAAWAKDGTLDDSSTYRIRPDGISLGRNREPELPPGGSLTVSFQGFRDTLARADGEVRASTEVAAAPMPQGPGGVR